MSYNLHLHRFHQVDSERKIDEIGLNHSNLPSLSVHVVLVVLVVVVDPGCLLMQH